MRTRLFYARPSRDPDAFRIVVGLPYHRKRPFLLTLSPLYSVDVLNRLCPSYFKKPRLDPATYKEPDPRALAKDARHLSKYIFPSQYGLSSVFMHRQQTYQQPDYSDREQEIKVRVSHTCQHEFDVWCRSLATVKPLSALEKFCR